MMTFNETRFTGTNDILIISEGRYFNLVQRNRSKKVLDLAINLPKGYEPPNRKFIPKYLLDLVHDQKMERNFFDKKRVIYF